MSQPDLWFPKRWPASHPDKIQLYSLATPNGQKVSIALEELQLPYEAHRIDIGDGDQFDEDFLRINPNGKIPALSDPDGPGGRQILMMESGAILYYLADKTGRLIPRRDDGRYQTLQWLYFQVGHVGPMFGQFGHFHVYARDNCDHPYPHKRYKNETQRLLGVLDKRLKDRDFILGEEYSIADIAIWPWVDALGRFYEAEELLELDSFEQVQRWHRQIASRDAVKKGREVCPVE
ncbi:glutathione S-transferase N-terminal domain-containing protein [Bowmanella dokdonensis]|uniref:Glutathione S-transferase N-terminal domain-containing protein n=1 Tax=Bowmanella dokdonensis TaxID=751969 RepID=A0A939DMY5_9ALTE|nr:glutathione S-transferase N-terminal domain-containing protein [Bowmanella dokdonensis]MBN7825739.1 glutathione S-transferase N-terminal domain-containing protein [Bowmanella dokdonensis]